MFQRLPLLVMPRPFRALHISLRPLPRSELSNISFTTGAVAGSTSQGGTLLHPVADLDSLVAEGGLGGEEEAA